MREKDAQHNAKMHRDPASALRSSFTASLKYRIAQKSQTICSQIYVHIYIYIRGWGPAAKNISQTNNIKATELQEACS